MKVKIIKREYHEYGDTNKPLHIDDEVFINDTPLIMGEGTAAIYKGYCERHKKETWHISGYNQNGHDCMSICLECIEILNHYLRYNYQE